MKGVGKVKFEDLGEEATADPDAFIPKAFKEVPENIETNPDDFLIADLPLYEERRLSIDDAFLYLLELFGKKVLIQKPLISLYDERFPEKINSVSEIIPLAHTIAKIMDIDPNDLEIGFFEAGIREFDPDTGDTIYYEQEPVAGLYHGKNEQGKYVVTISDDIHGEVDRVISTIAHEFSHIKLLGEGRMEENAEELTDMVPLFYGLGLFNANTSFKFDKHNRGWAHSRLGYLGQVDWGYLWALYLYVREEQEPEWFKYLNKTVARDCRRALEFIQANKEKVLQTAPDRNT